MTLKLLVDECILDKLLVRKLREAGHDVRTVTEAGLIRKPDHAVFQEAIAEERMVITTNCADFLMLSEQRLSKEDSHPGVLLVYRYNIPSKEMSHDDIVKAIVNLELAGVPLENNCHVLNCYRY